MKQRKIKVINRKFQIGSAVKISLVSLSAFLAVLLILGLVTYRGNREIVDNMTELEKAVTVENDLIKAFSVYARRTKGTGMLVNVEQVVRDHEESIRAISDFAEMSRSVARSNYHILFAGIFIVVIQAVMMFIIIIRLTHRVSGPERVLEKHLDAILEGREPEFRPLRDNDELAGLYERLRRLHGMMKN